MPTAPSRRGALWQSAHALARARACRLPHRDQGPRDLSRLGPNRERERIIKNRGEMTQAPAGLQRRRDNAGERAPCPCGGGGRHRAAIVHSSGEAASGRPVIARATFPPPPRPAWLAVQVEVAAVWPPGVCRLWICARRAVGVLLRPRGQDGGARRRRRVAALGALRLRVWGQAGRSTDHRQRKLKIMTASGSRETVAPADPFDACPVMETRASGTLHPSASVERSSIIDVVCRSPVAPSVVCSRHHALRGVCICRSRSEAAA